MSSERGCKGSGGIEVVKAGATGRDVADLGVYLNPLKARKGSIMTDLETSGFCCIRLI